MTAYIVPEKPSDKQAAAAAERQAAAMSNIASALWESINGQPDVPLVKALNNIGSGLHRIADALEARNDDALEARNAEFLVAASAGMPHDD